MDLINNRYRVLKTIKQNKLVSSYLVTDVKANSEPMQLNIINREYIPEEVLSYFIKEFRTLTTIDNNNVVKLYIFGTINFIDNKKIGNVQYFYINENIEESFDFAKLVGDLGNDSILDLFIEICQCLNYLHLRGFIYGDLNIKNIFIKDSKIKLKDIATVALEKYDYWTRKDNQIIFRAPEILAGGQANVLSDIYSLGVLLFFMCKKEINENLRIANELTNINSIKNIKNSDCKEFFNKLADIIGRMTEQNPANRYENISQVIEDINKVFNKGYKSLDKNQLEKLNFKTKLVGREYEVKRVLNMCSSKEIKEKFICFHGEAGIGKTRLLKELEFLLSMQKANVYGTFTLEDNSSSRNKGFYEILRKLIAECDQEILERYETDLVKLVPELAEKKHIDPEKPLYGEKEKLRIINSVCAFVGDFLKGKPTIFIIDDLHLAGELSIELLEHIHLRMKNTIIIFSYRDGEILSNKAFSEFMTKFGSKENFIDSTLFGLEKDNIISMIQDILRSQKKLTRFGNSIFLKTYGNPQFVEETIKKLFSEKVIYIYEKTGKWNSEYYDYDKLPIPANMEQAVLSQIKDLDEISSEVLKVLSLFHFGIQLEELVTMLDYTELETKKSINVLESRGILIRKIEDRGFIYDFSNRILKNLVRSRLDKDYKIEKHKIAAKLLEGLYNNGIENKEELIYHLEKAKEYEKAIKYCLENADNMEKLKSREEATKYILRAFSMLKPSEKLMKLKLLLRLGNIYDEAGNAASSIKYLEEAMSIAEGMEDFKYHVDVLIKLAGVYIKKNEIEKTMYYIKTCEEIINKSNAIGKYTKGYLEFKEIQARVFFIKQDYKSVKEICVKGIELCKDEYLKLKGLFYKNLGNSYIETVKIDKALKCYEKSLSCFQAIDYSEGIVIALNNLSVVYGDFYQDNEKGIKYMVKMKEISEKNHIVIYEIMALANLASYYYNDFAYELALDYLLEALGKSQKVEFESNVFYCYNYISSVYLKLGNYKEAYEYYKFAEKEFEEYPDQGREIALYYQMASELFYSLGYYEKAKELICKTLDIYGTDEFMVKWDSIILLQYIQLCMKKNDEDISENLEVIRSTISKYKSPLKRLDTIYNTIIVLKDRGFNEAALKLLPVLDKMEVSEKPNTLKLKELYIRGAFNKKNNVLKDLNTAVDLAKLVNDKVFHFKICCALGEFYYSKKDYFYAVNYYFEACEIIKNIANSIPEDIGIKFVNRPDIIKPFKVLLEMTKGINSNEQLVVNSRELFVKLFDFSQFESILTNKDFIKSAHKIYNASLPKKIRNSKGIIRNLYSDPIKNLDIIAKYLASVTLATKSLIIIDDYEESYYTIASNDGSSQVPSIRFLFERAREVKEPLLLNDEELLPQGIKAVICIPIIMNFGDVFEENRMKNINIFSRNSIKGYIYLETDRILNNFNMEGLRKCTELSRLTGSIIEKYQLTISSSIDKLTGMLTRKFLEDELSEHIDRADKFNRVFSIVMLDLDHFKHINDKFGHQTGDEVLRKTCQIIKNSLREEDVCGRYGGEEFIIILPDTDVTAALKIANTLRLEIENAQILGDKNQVTVSMGIAAYPLNAQWKQELIEKADQALYVSKETGRNRCAVWNSNFTNKSKPTDKLLGIISGNTVEDSRKVLAMLDVIELIKQDIKVEDKIFNLLGRIVEMTEAEYGMLFIVEDGKIKKNYSRRIFEEALIDAPNYNEDIIDNVINKRQGTYRTDWDENVSFDSITGRPDWHSIAVTPLMKNGEVKAVLYLIVSTEDKEFKFEDFNFINTLGELAVGIL